MRNILVFFSRIGVTMHSSENVKCVENVCTLMSLSTIWLSPLHFLQQITIIWTRSNVVRKPELLKLRENVLKYTELRVFFNRSPPTKSRCFLSFVHNKQSYSYLHSSTVQTQQILSSFFLCTC